MKKTRFLYTAAAAALLLTGCFSEKDSPSSISLTRDDTVSASSAVFTVNTGLLTYLDYSLSSDSAKEAYFVFSNAGTSDADRAATVTSQPAASYSASAVAVNAPYGRSRILKDHPGTRAFEQNPPAFETGTVPLRSMSASTAAKSDSLLQTRTFYSADNVSIPATCRYVSPAVTTSQGTRTLSVWVADDCWHEGGTKTYLVTPVMVEALENTFLNADAWNGSKPQKTSLPTGASSYDIYGLVTSIFGAEWGPHSYSKLITADGSITILLSDLNGTNNPGGLIGYFYSRDCFLSSYYQTPNSNERMMFFLDAVSFAYSTGTWSISDFWPEQIISTLAHEFQHMIMFYQKTVSRKGGSAPTWLNEMCSLAAEDFVSSNIGIAGPRGVDISVTDGSAGAAGMDSARISDMVGASDWHLYSWPGSGADLKTILAAYGQAYALGAYLARDFGGAPLFTAIVQSSSNGTAAVSAALSSLGYSESFDTAFAKFGAALILSDSTTAPQYYRYNTGSWFTSKADGIDYSLGSINAFNYTDSANTGPYVFSVLPETALPKGSIVTYDAGSVSGTAAWKMTLPAGTILTVVAK